MNKVTHEAIIASIMHWEENLREENIHNVKIYSVDCPLCKIFYREKGANKICKNCPVSLKTTLGACMGSPWTYAQATLDQWFNWYEDWQNGKVTKKQVERLALVSVLLVKPKLNF